MRYLHISLLSCEMQKQKVKCPEAVLGLFGVGVQKVSGICLAELSRFKSWRVSHSMVYHGQDFRMLPFHKDHQ